MVFIHFTGTAAQYVLNVSPIISSSCADVNTTVPECLWELTFLRSISSCDSFSPTLQFDDLNGSFTEQYMCTVFTTLLKAAGTALIDATSLKQMGFSQVLIWRSSRVIWTDTASAECLLSMHWDWQRTLTRLWISVRAGEVVSLQLRHETLF